MKMIADSRFTRSLQDRQQLVKQIFWFPGTAGFVLPEKCRGTNGPTVSTDMLSQSGQ